MTCDGKASRELSRKLGEASKTFRQLHQIWSRASIGRKRKIIIYNSCVLSKLLYSLESVWLLKADRARLDAFHYRCLRRLLGIAPSFFSRIPNAEVLRKAGVSELSHILLVRQRSLYNKIANSPISSLIRSLVCNVDGSPRSWAARRKRGRPRQQWAQEVYKQTQYH